MGGACSTYGESRGVYRGLVGNPEGRRLPGIDGMIILKWIFRKWMWGIDWIDLTQDREAGSFECGNGLSGSTKCGEFLD